MFSAHWKLLRLLFTKWRDWLKVCMYLSLKKHVLVWPNRKALHFHALLQSGLLLFLYPRSKISLHNHHHLSLSLSRSLVRTRRHLSRTSVFSRKENALQQINTIVLWSWDLNCLVHKIHKLIASYCYTFLPNRNDLPVVLVKPSTGHLDFACRVSLPCIRQNDGSDVISRYPLSVVFCGSVKRSDLFCAGSSPGRYWREPNPQRAEERRRFYVQLQGSILLGLIPRCPIPDRVHAPLGV